MNKSIAVVHCLTECDDCGTRFQNYKNAQALAALHARTHRHTVRGEVGLAFTYDGKNTPKTHPQGRRKKGEPGTATHKPEK